MVSENPTWEIMTEQDVVLVVRRWKQVMHENGYDSTNPHYLKEKDVTFSVHYLHVNKL